MQSSLFQKDLLTAHKPTPAPPRRGASFGASVASSPPGRGAGVGAWESPRAKFGAHWDHEPREQTSTQLIAVQQSSAALGPARWIESARGLAQSKTWRFMESLHNSSIAHRDHEPREQPSTRQRLGVRQSSAAFGPARWIESARGLAQSKTWRFMESLHNSSIAHRDHEP